MQVFMHAFKELRKMSPKTSNDGSWAQDWDHLLPKTLSRVSRPTARPSKSNFKPWSEKETLLSVRKSSLLMQ